MAMFWLFALTMSKTHIVTESTISLSRGCIDSVHKHDDLIMDARHHASSKCLQSKEQKRRFGFADRAFSPHRFAGRLLIEMKLSIEPPNIVVGG